MVDPDFAGATVDTRLASDGTAVLDDRWDASAADIVAGRGATVAAVGVRLTDKAGDIEAGRGATAARTGADVRDRRPADMAAGTGPDVRVIVEAISANLGMPTPGIS